MRLRADGSGSVRIVLERAARLLALAIVVWFLIQSLRRPSGTTETVDLTSLPASLASWSTASAPARVHVRIDRALSPTQRDWLAALDAVGTRATWEGHGVLPLAAVAEPIADPVGATGIWAAAPAGARLVLSDRVGALDSARAGPAGARFLARSAPAMAGVRAGALVARAAVSDSLVFKRLLVIGRVGWESKFVTASLEERGWTVDARLALSPKGDVVQGGKARIDTGRYAAVIALDSSALAVAGQLAPYVRAGGGLVLEARPAMAQALAPLRAGSAGAVIAAAMPFDSVPLAPRRALALMPLSLDDAAVPIERRDTLVAVAARRVEHGRVVMIGYDDTWRWRMGGKGGMEGSDTDVLEQYREWWAGLVARVANVGRVPRPSSSPTDEAPFAHLVERLGSPSPPPSTATQHRGIPTGWLFGIFAVAVLFDWASRRLRGVP